MSDKYCGKDISELKLQHWKYIKRERVGNKWKYYYDTDSLKSDVKDKLKDKIGYDEKENLDKAYSKYDLAVQDIVDNPGGVGKFDPYTGELPHTSREKEYQNGTFDMKSKAFKKVAAAGKNVSEAAIAYYNTPLGKVDKVKSSMSDAKKKVSHFLDKVKDSIKFKSKDVKNKS